MNFSEQLLAVRDHAKAKFAALSNHPLPEGVEVSDEINYLFDALEYYVIAQLRDTGEVVLTYDDFDFHIDGNVVTLRTLTGKLYATFNANGKMQTDETDQKESKGIFAWLRSQKKPLNG